MIGFCRRSFGALLVLAAFAVALAPGSGHAESAAEIDKNIKDALTKLYSESSSAKELSSHAKAILVFPRIIKAGFMIGGQYGDEAAFHH